jgi:diguanylate cyclase (GGDEF)-like protein
MAFASLVITLGLADQTMHARRERDIADNLAHHDALTGAFNRRAVVSRLGLAVTDAHQSEQPLALLFLDVDHFKALNDTHGHAAGDHCLQVIVEAINHELRSGDWLGRYGGEEFIIVLPGASRTSAEQIGERVRARIETLRVQVNGRLLRMTISVGVAGLLDQRDTAAALIERADAALYCAKSDGRNRLSTHPTLAAVASA